jgi:ketosteroid isomerase-like protein
MTLDDPGGPLAAFRRYTDAFQTLDARSVASHFHEPALLISPQDTVAFPTTAAVEQFYASLMAELPARGYARTAFSALSERHLSDDLAVVSGDGVWKNASDEDLMPFGITYTLRRSGETWRIVVAVIHAPQGIFAQ